MIIGSVISFIVQYFHRFSTLALLKKFNSVISLIEYLDLRIANTLVLKGREIYNWWWYVKPK
jgi:hypothetical protein